MEAQSAFERLSFTHREEYVAWINSAKRAETRTNLIAKTLHMLREGKKAP
ncbi:MAG: YdeI/OmpD-associated family protein [Chloroflexota bacterium]|nr:YdeI/OmpD-associated family protein [Chloroflexota bacterium]